MRSVYEAKLAELDVLHQSRMRTTPDPEARAVRDEEFRRERERLTSERDTKVARIRTGNGETG